MGSRGSIIPFFLSLKDQKTIPITDVRMTRFMISLEQGVNLVWHAFNDMIGGEIYVKKIPSIKVTDIAKVIAPNSRFEIIGIRPGEKLHEQMIGYEDSFTTFEYKDHFKILPQLNNWGKDKKRIKLGKKVKDGFIYNSDNNRDWMTKTYLKNWIRANYKFIGNF
jgi:FlaA1/EpsC-like NDP-sugar epimerase